MIRLGLCLLVAALAGLVHVLLLRKEFPVHSKGAILISGTSSGIGRATCGWLAQRHTEVTFYCGVRSPGNTSGYPFDLPNVEQVILDVTNQEQVDAVLQKITMAAEQPLIGIVNNAGIFEMSTFEFIGVNKLQKLLEVNVVGTYRLTQAALPILRANQGRIVTVGSISGLIPGSPLGAAYQASKYALEAMFDALRVEVAPYEVSVSMVEPGYLKTSMQERFLQKPDETNTEEIKAYPHVMGETYHGLMREVASYSGRMEETCQSIEDALFGKYPKTRYLTSQLGPFPAWIAVRFANAIPTRLADLLMTRLDVLIYLQRARIFVERLLGVQ